MLSITILSACGNSDKDTNAVNLPEKFTINAYNTVEPKGIDQTEKLSGTWIMLGHGTKTTEESTLIAGKPRLEESVNTQFNLREIIRIGYDNANNSYFFTSCGGIGERELTIENKKSAHTTYGPSLMDMQLDLSNDHYLQANINVSENFSDTRLAKYNLTAKLYKLNQQDNFGNFTFQSATTNAKWSQALSQKESFDAQCFAEKQGTFERKDYAFTTDKEHHQINGGFHTLGIEGPIEAELSDNNTAANLYVEFSLHENGKSPLQLKAASNIYAKNGKNNAIWEIAYDDWQTQFLQNEKPDIQWHYPLADNTQLNASFKAAIGSENAFSANFKLKI